MTINYGPGELRLEVRDDGAGNRGTGGGPGYGLVGIRERVKIFGGEMSAAPAPGGGFLVRAYLPIGGDVL